MHREDAATGWRRAKAFADVPDVAWSNGGGRTVELVSYAESADFDQAAPRAPWRLSVATLLTPGPFSPLHGVDRIFLPADGTVVLRVNGESRVITAGTVARFRGDDDVFLEKLDSRCRAVNLMVRADEGSAPVDLTIAEGPATPEAALAWVCLEPSDGVEAFDLCVPARDGRFSATTVPTRAVVVAV